MSDAGPSGIPGIGGSWGFHPLGGDGGGEAPSPPSSDQAPPLHPLTGMPSSMHTVGETSPVNDPSKNVYQGTQFAQTGLGRYMNRNANGLQFNKPAVMDAVKTGIQMHDDAKYYREHGIGAATRNWLGMKQVPSHRNDDINSRYQRNTRPVTGRNPGHYAATQEENPSADPNDLIF